MTHAVTVVFVVGYPHKILFYIRVTSKCHIHLSSTIIIIKLPLSCTVHMCITDVFMH